MPGSGSLSGPPSNKAVASTLAAALATLFWTIAAHTFWKSVSTADLTLYITTSTVIVTAFVSYIFPESVAYAAYTQQRRYVKAANLVSAKTDAAAGSVDARVQGVEARLHSIEARLPAGPPPDMPAQLGTDPAFAIQAPNSGAGG